MLRNLSQTGITISSGRLIACHTKDNAVLVIVVNPDDEWELPVRITIEKRPGLTADPQTSREVVLLKETQTERVYRTLLPKGDLLMMLFR